MYNGSREITLKLIFMPKKNAKQFKCVAFEGGDQAGKADAVLTFCKKALEKGHSLTYASVPMYASPFGSAIHLMLKNGLEPVKIADLDEKKELKLVMTMFVCDRLQFMNVLLSDEKYKNTLLVLDRSPFSNAVTIAYGIARMKSLGSKDIKELIDFAFEIEDFMISKLNLNNCVVELISLQHNWNNLRTKDVDRNESSDVQANCRQAYGEFEKKVGNGWKKIVTRGEDGWRDRGDIFKDVYTFVLERYGKLEKGKNPELLDINIQELLEKVYIGTNIQPGEVQGYMNNLKENGKEAMYEAGEKLAKKCVKECEEIRIETDIVRNAYLKIVKEMPEILDIVSYYTDPVFKDKFSKAIGYVSKEGSSK